MLIMHTCSLKNKNNYQWFNSWKLWYQSRDNLFLILTLAIKLGNWFCMIHIYLDIRQFKSSYYWLNQRRDNSDIVKTWYICDKKSRKKWVFYEKLWVGRTIWEHISRPRSTISNVRRTPEICIYISSCSSALFFKIHWH